MTYPKQLSDRALTLLEPILPRITELKEGEGLSLESQSINEILYALYSWRHINSLVGTFKISKDSPTSARVTRRVSSPSIIEESNEPAKRRGIAFTQEKLIEVLNEEEAIKLIKKSLSVEEMLYALEEWRRIND